MNEPSPLPPPSPSPGPPGEQQSPLDAPATSLQVRHGKLPRIRASQHAETVSEVATNDISSVGALAPGSTIAGPTNASDPERPQTYLAARRASHAAAAVAQASEPLHRMLSRFDAPDRVRWSGISMVLFYILTVITWPSMLVSGLGVGTGVIGFISCSQPYTVNKIMWVYVYQWLNIAMLVVIWWSAIDQLVLHGDGSASAGVSYMYQAAFILLGSVLHGRTLSATGALIRKCGLWELIVEVVWPERWRRQSQAEAATDPPAEVEPSVEPRPSLLSGEERESSVSSVHSFEIDVDWHQDRQPSQGLRGDACGSPVTSPRASPSPVTSYQRIDEPRL